MDDVGIQQRDLEWTIKLPETIKTGETLTVVCRIPEKVEFQVLEAVEVTASGETGERFEGDGTHTGPGFNDDGVASTYVWFFITLDREGKYKIKFRMTWTNSRYYMFGAVETLEIEAGDSYDPPSYSLYERELLLILLDW